MKIIKFFLIGIISILIPIIIIYLLNLIPYIGTIIVNGIGIIIVISLITTLGWAIIELMK